MANRLFNAMPFPEPVLPYCHLNPNEQTFNKKFDQITNILFQGNSFENFVCKMSTILFIPCGDDDVTFLPGSDCIVVVEKSGMDSVPGE